MATKKQHFVPQVYIKAWETLVETHKEPHKKFNGVYVFENSTTIGDGRTKESILWEPHLYTIKFSQLYIGKKCPGVYNYYVDAVYDAMVNNDPAPVYGRYGHSIIKTRKSIWKHLNDIEDWDFYYYNGDNARKKGILNKISDIRCYILEDAFSKYFETHWESVRDTFVKEVQNGNPLSVGQSERQIDRNAATNMLQFFFMMLCRSPNFDAMGVYAWMHNILGSAFGCDDMVDEMMEAVWFSELYKIFFKSSGGFYRTILSETIRGCQLILFEANNDAEFFVASDNPAFQNNCAILRQNENGFIFPLSPKHLLFIAKGSEDISVVDYRFANKETVRHFNQIIKNNMFDTLIGVKKELAQLI